LDYGNLTPFEQNFMKRVIPFYSFARQNLEHQLSVLSNNPRAFSTQAKFFKSLKDMLGTDVSQDDMSALPDWMKTGLSIPIDNKDGNVTMLTSFGEPTSALNNLIGTSPQDTLRKMISNSNPMLKIPIEQALGVNTFSNTPIVSDTNRDATRFADAPQLIKSLLGYNEVNKTDSKGNKYIQKTVDPQAAYWLANIPIASSLSTVGKRTTEGGINPLASTFGNIDPWKAAQVASGARVYTKNVAASRAQKERDMQKQVEDVLYRKGLGSTYTTFSLNSTKAKKSSPIKPLKKLGS
jgi:hypothetical protein